MTNLEFLENKYLVLNFKKSEFKNILIYKLIQEDSKCDLKFDFLASIPYDYENFYRIKDMIIFKTHKKLLFNKISRSENNFEEIFSFDCTTEHSVEIQDINKDKILVKFIKNKGNPYLMKFEIYNIKTRQKISAFHFGRPFDDILFLNNKYLLLIQDNSFDIIKSDSLTF